MIFELSCYKEYPLGGRRSSKHGDPKYFEPLRWEISPPFDVLDQSKNTHWATRPMMKEAEEGFPFAINVFDRDLNKCN